MSRIDKMSIQGIRNFDPDKASTVTFYSPLTLIMGQNGCGKTTIIECLKYITTGDVPPGCGKGGATFVHDPKLANVATVRGRIVLVFHEKKNARGNCPEVKAARSIEVTQKSKKLECKTLDSTIVRKREDGTPCIVSRPLEEGKKVKDKFDAIFSATRYIKCLDVISKLRKEKMGDIRQNEAVLVEYKKWKVMAEEKRMELRDIQGQRDGCHTQKDRMAAERVPMVEQLRKLKAIQEDYSGNMRKLGSLQEKEKLLRESEQELLRAQTETFKCDDDELANKITQFQWIMKEKERELKMMESQIMEITRDINSTHQEETRAERRLGELESEHRRQSERVKDRNGKLVELVTQLGFSEYRGVIDFSESQAKDVLVKVTKFLEEEQVRIAAKKQEFEVQEGEIQEQIDKLRAQEGALNGDVHSKRKFLEELARKMRTTRDVLNASEDELVGCSLAKTKEEVKQVEAAIQCQEGKYNANELQEEIERARHMHKKTDRELDDAKQMVLKMCRQQEDRSKLELLQKDSSEIQARIEFLKNKNVDAIKKLLREIPQSNIKSRVDACANQLGHKVSDLRKKEQDLHSRKMQLDSMLSGHRIEIEKKEREMRDLENKIEAACEGMELEAAIGKCRVEIEKLAADQTDISGNKKFYDKCLSKLKITDCCPLCHRNFSSHADTQELIEEIEIKIAQEPGREDRLSRDLKRAKDNYDCLNQLTPQKERASTLKAEVETLRSAIERETRDAREATNELEASKEELKLAIEDEQLARSLQPDMALVDNHLKKIASLTEQIELLNTALGMSDSSMTLDEARSIETQQETVFREAQKVIDEKTKTLWDHRECLNTLREKRNYFEKKLQDIQKRQQDADQARKELDNLEIQKIQVTQDMENAKRDLAPVSADIQRKSEEKGLTIKQKDNWSEQENRKLEVIRDAQKNARQINLDIGRYLQGGQDEELVQCQRRVASLKEIWAEKEGKKKTLEGQVQKEQKEVANQLQHRNNLDNEDRIRKKRQERSELVKEIESLELMIKQSNLQQAENDLRKINDQVLKIDNETSVLVGRITEIEKKIRDLEMDLRSKAFRDVDKNYFEMLVKIKCAKMATNDLDKYYKALDTAIMRFHREKMEMINRIISDLWRVTYQGHDIDSIEIKTDETESAGSDKRRTFNYRVVMHKRGIEMDMRGRCSAGQKVLASLVIRMALAETFSLNCGILALDEPTTNLDVENINALAMALNNIVQQRSQQNFQLIVISHDTHFINILAHESGYEYYQEVKRNPEQKSVVVRKSVI